MIPATSEWDWVLTDFVARTAKVAHAVVVSTDGLLVARSERLPQDRAEQLSAVVAGLVGLTSGAARCLDLGQVRTCVVEMARGYLLVTSIAGGGSLGVLAAPEVELGLVGYEIAKLAESFDRPFTPDPRGTSLEARATA
jgi:uncharacterized protein